MKSADTSAVFGDTDGAAEQVIYVQADEAKQIPISAIINRQPKYRIRNGVEFSPLMETSFAQSLVPKPNEGNDKIIVALRPGKPATSREVIHVDDDGAGGWIIELG